MSVPPPDSPFFIGWSRRVPASLLRFSAAVAAGVMLLLGLAGVLLGRSVEDSASRLLALTPAVESRPQDWAADQTLRGAVSTMPFPMLHVPADAGHPAGRTVLLSGDGKRGATLPPGATGVEVTGGLLQRGDVAMLVVETARPVESEPAPERQSLGRWRIAGEICDGKCYSGAMRPGSGLSHRACATLCLIGEVPAIFVAASPVSGKSFLVLAGPDGGPPPSGLRGLTALPVVLEGEVQRVGDILILLADLDKAQPL